LPEYPDLAIKALKTLLLFPTSYLCESGFSVMVEINTKPRNSLDVWATLREPLSSIISRWERLVVAKQAQGSHWIKVLTTYTSCKEILIAEHLWFLKAGPRKNFPFKPVRSAKKVADPCSKPPDIIALSETRTKETAIIAPSRS